MTLTADITFTTIGGGFGKFLSSVISDLEMFFMTKLISFW
jgi:hypothetical protein